MGKGWGDAKVEGMAGQSRAGEAPRRPVMRLPEARNDKPPVTGVDAAGGLPLRFKCELGVDEILTDCSSHVNHPSTPTCSGTLVGETTHRVTLNLDRGSQPLGARRQSGSANGNGATREK